MSTASVTASRSTRPSMRASQAKAKAKPKGKSGVHEMSLSQIDDAADLQPRRQMDLDTLREYSNAWLEGAKFPPVVVFYDGETYWLADGFYRVRSARKAGLLTIRAVVYDGEKRDALLYSVGANATHGVRRTNEDKKKAVIVLLDDPEWCLWSDDEIAKACKVSASTVGRYRAGSPGLKGHGVTVRIGSNGHLTAGRPVKPAPENVPQATFRRPPVMMSQREIADKFTRRITNHLKKGDPELASNVEYAFGAVEIVTKDMLYAFSLVTSTAVLYQVLGRLMVARSFINPKAGITIVGHFPQALGELIGALRNMGVFCETPEQILAR